MTFFHSLGIIHQHIQSSFNLKRGLREMKKALIIITTVIIGITVTVPLINYGTLSPCGMLNKKMKQDYLSSSLAEIDTDNAFSTIGGLIGNTLISNTIDNTIDGMTPMQCVDTLYNVTFNKSNIFEDELFSPDSYSTYDTSTHNEPNPTPIEPAKPEWSSFTKTSKIDDSTNVYIAKDSNDYYHGDFGNKITPSIHMRCVEDTTELYINAGDMIDNVYRSSRYGGSYVPLTIRLGEEDAFEIEGSRSTNNEAAFIHNPIPLIKNLLKNEKMVIRYRLYGGGNKTITFDLNGLDEQIPALREACHW